MNEKIEQIKLFYLEAFQKLNSQKKVSQITVEFYRYVGINHTIRLRENKVKVRISNLFEAAPPEVQRSLAFILTAKLCKKQLLTEIEEPYRKYSKSIEIQNLAKQSRQLRGRKIISGSMGKVFDLNRIFDYLNQIYFDGKLHQPTLTWSTKKSFRILGHHDSAHDVIVLSQILDNSEVPHYVVEYVMYHEMLHVKHPVEIINGRRNIHSSAFRQDEKNFAYFIEAEKWIEKNLSKISQKTLKSKKTRSLRKIFNF